VRKLSGRQIQVLVPTTLAPAGVDAGRSESRWHEDLDLPTAELPHLIVAYKKAIEPLTTHGLRDSGIEPLVLRIGTVWGPLGDPESPFFPIPSYINAAIRGEEPPPLYADDGGDRCYSADAGRAIALLMTTETLRQLAGQGAAAGRRVLIATIIAPAKPDFIRRPVWSGSVSDLVAGVNADLKETRWPDGASVIDLSSALVSEDKKTLADEFRSDTLHLNTAGYRRLTELLMPRLQSALDTELRNPTK